MSSVVLNSCQPKADYITIEYPMQEYSPTKSDTLRGANSIEQLSCYFFMALKQTISFEQFEQVIPDSAEIVQLYIITKTSFADADLHLMSDTIHKRLQIDLLKAIGGATNVRGSWTNAEFERVMIFPMEDKTIPGKKITVQAKSDQVYLRATVKCMQINGRWFIGEDIHYGV